MESVSLSTILNGEVRRLAGVNFEQNPYTIVVKLDEVDDWISDQEQILGVKWIKFRGEAESSGSFRVEKYYCHRHGKKRAYVSNVPENKQRPNQKSSIKVGCNAYFWIRQRPNSDDVDIEYHWQHLYHTPSSISHLDYSRFPTRGMFHFINLLQFRYTVQYFNYH